MTNLNPTETFEISIGTYEQETVLPDRMTIQEAEALIPRLESGELGILFTESSTITAKAENGGMFTMVNEGEWESI